MTSSKLSLVIDGCGSNVFTGLLDSEGAWLAKTSLEGAPLEQLFQRVEQTLSDAGIKLSEIGSYIYCAGPGSVLGLRLCAMAIETWSRLYPSSAKFYAYNSLSLVTAELLRSTTGLKDAINVTDWKKGAWNSTTIKDGNICPVTVVDQDTVDNRKETLYHLPQRKGWQAAPTDAVSVAYDPSLLADLRTSEGLLRETTGVQLYSTRINTFQKWSPQRHRAPSI